MPPDGFVSLIDTNGYYDPTAETEAVAKAVFAKEHQCLSKEVDTLIDGEPELQEEFDAIMDFVARDNLLDDCTMAVVENTFIHLSDLGLINASPVKVVPGVSISHYSPYQIDRVLNHKE